jgi:hypothetical protein
MRLRKREQDVGLVAISHPHSYSLLYNYMYLLMAYSNQTRSIMTKTPIVLQSKSLLDSMTTILSLETQTILLICLSKISFIKAVLEDVKRTENHLGKHSILIPTLESIDCGTKVRVYFCDSLPSLHSRMAVLNGRCKSLVVVYPLMLHVDLSAHSAQGLGKTISSAVDAAIRLDARLMLMEPLTRIQRTIDETFELQDTQDEGPMNQNPWDQHLPILNATASRFGSERGWVGRTVSARQIVNRWCTWE